MKNLRLFLSAAGMSMISFVFAQNNVFDNLKDATVVGHSKYTGLPNFIKFNPGVQMNEASLLPWIQDNFKLDPSISFKSYSVEQDRIGFTHIRYREYIGKYPIDNTMLIAHIKDGNVISFNGDFYQSVNIGMVNSLSEQTALKDALKNVNAVKYKWENKDEEAQLRIIKKDPTFTFYPKGELVIIHKDGTDFSAASLRLAWKFDVYASEPLSRAYIYVDAQTGEIISKQNRIHDLDVVGTANTVYSGVKPMTSDSFALNNFRLRETGRGNGIETYNLNYGTNYTNTDFTSNSRNWNLPVANQAASDAHWGAEVTYDYFNQVHGRNSIDGLGFALLSYVHYSTNFVNAFWDGQEMTYGDGDVSQGYTTMTGLDVCAHEISHGLTTFTANLSGGEADALNEGNSDIFGNTIEAFARPSQWSWILGEDISVNHLGFRNMADPNSSAYPGPQPDTYLGTYWDAAGESHNNDGPFIYWYYLLCQGGSGTNDIGSVYNVTGITMTEARMVEFRGLTVYMTPSTDYAAARMYTIQAAQDLYGACSPEVIATTNAWYAVGVGAAFSGTVTASFTSNITTSCNLPVTVNFTNTSSNVSNATWYFGDNTTSTTFNPSHTYTQAGTYNVAVAVSSTCGTDSISQSSFITITPPPAPTGTDMSSCSSASFNLTGTGSGTLAWYTAPTGGVPVGTGTTYTTPVLNATTTYYLENQVAQAPGFVGPTSYNFGTGGQHNNSSTQYLEFTVSSNCTLATADVNAGGAGNKTFILWDNAGNQLNSYTVNVPATGVQTITLNIPLTPGSYRIGGSNMNLYRNNSGPTYPYNLSGGLSITGSSAGSGYYYYLYNWEITFPPCAGARVPVVATIGALMVSFNTTAFDTVCIADAPFSLSGGVPAGGVYSGPGVTGGVFDPSVAGAGSHTLVYTYTDTSSCVATIPATVVVDACTGIHAAETSTGISVYPNPANDFVTVELQLGNAQEVEMNLLNMLGQIVYSNEINSSAGISKVNINTVSLPRGIYLLQVKTVAGTEIRKVELQ